MRIEAVSLLRRPGAVHAVAVELAGPQSGHVAVPDLVGVLGERDPRRLVSARNRRKGTAPRAWRWPKRAQN